MADYIKNGSALVSSQNLQLNYSKLTEVNPYAPSNYITVDTNTGAVSKTASSVPSPLTITVNATDANGTGDTSPTQTHILNFGPAPWNLTAGSTTPACVSPNSYTVVYISTSIPNASNFPSGFPTSPCTSGPTSSCYIASLASGSTQVLTQGTAEFKFSLESLNCTSSSGNTAYMTCWVYYRQDSTQPWVIAHPISGSDIDGNPGTSQIGISMSSVGSVSISRRYNMLGEYRMMANYNNPLCSSCSGRIIPKIEWFDANYP